MENLPSCLSFAREQFSNLRNGDKNLYADARERLITLAEVFASPELRQKLQNGHPFSPQEEETWFSLVFSDVGVFVNAQGLVVTGADSQTAGQIKGSHQGRFDLELPPQARKILQSTPGSTCLLFDWNDQDLDWPTLTDKWRLWKNSILVSGPVDFPWELVGQCRYPHFVVVKPGESLPGLKTLPQKAPHTVHPQSTAILNESVQGEKAPSFLARAAQFKSAHSDSPPHENLTEPLPILNPVPSIEASPSTSTSYDDENFEELPMIPFTLQDLRSPQFLWPQGVENLQVNMVKNLSHTPIAPVPSTSTKESPGDLSDFVHLEVPPSPLKKKKKGKKLLLSLTVILALGVGFYLWYSWGGGAKLLPGLKLPLLIPSLS